MGKKCEVKQKNGVIDESNKYKVRGCANGRRSWGANLEFVQTKKGENKKLFKCKSLYKQTEKIKTCQMQEFMQKERENVCKPCQRQQRSQSCWSPPSESPTFLLSGKERMQLSFLMMLMVIIFMSI